MSDLRNLLRLIFCAAALLMANVAAAANFTVNMTGFQFSPRNLTVNAGDTVTWVNQDGTRHDTVSGQNGIFNGVWRSALLNNGQSFSFTLNVAAGTYPYFCSPHVFSFNMVGSITVVAPNAPPSVSIINPASGATFTAGANVLIEASASDDNGVERVEFFANGNPIGTDFTAPYLTSLNNIAVGNYSLTAIAFDNQGLFATSGAVNISVNETTSAPSIISQPQSQSVFPGTNVTFFVVASGTPPLSYQWQFNGTDIFGATMSSLTLGNVQTNESGNYAVRVSNEAGSTLSATAILTVTSLPNLPPQIAITSPANGARFRLGSTVFVQAQASDEDGGIAQVEFLLDSNSIAVLTNAPYEIAFSNLAAGEYVLTARATDNASGSTVSEAVNFSVLTPPVIELSPTNGARFLFGETIRLTAQVSVVAGLNVARFQFFEIVSNDLRAVSPAFLPGGTPLPRLPDGRVDTGLLPLPLGFLFDWTSAGLGMHTLVGVAIDELGGTNSSTPVTIAVIEPSAQNPTIAITNSPKNFSRLTNSPIFISGIAADDFRLKNVEFQVNGGPFLLATGTSNWIAEVALAAGTNVVEFRAVDLAGNFSTNETRSFTYVVNHPLPVQVRGLGKVSPNLNGRMLEIGKFYQIIARPGAGHIFAGWSGAGISNKAVLNFQMMSNMTLTVDFKPNPFPSAKGIYLGLISETNGVRPESSGAFKLNVTARGTFSGRLTIQNKTYPMRGRLDHEGFAQFPVLRRPTTNVFVTLDLDLDENEITGEVTDNHHWTSDLRGGRVSVGARNPDLRGKKIPFQLISSDENFGNGIVDLNVVSKVRGRLSSGESFARPLPPLENGASPFYFSLNKGGAVLLGWLTLQNNLPLDNGELVLGTTNGFSALVDFVPAKQTGARQQ